jgi:hypothetical protein
MGVLERRPGTGIEGGQVDAEVAEIKEIAKRTLGSSGHARRKRLRIVGGL